jgi:hypothetical protein
MPLSAGEKLGPYTILAPTGARGMGQVDIRYCIAWLFESWPSNNLIRGLLTSVFGSAF